MTTLNHSPRVQSTRVAALAIGVVMVLGASASFAHAGHRESADHDNDPVLTYGGPHVRTDDPYVRWVIAMAVENSRTVRSLVDTIDASDVLVYIEMRKLPLRLGGKVAFMAASENVRYVRVTLATGADLLTTIALLGHELQHVVEVARDPLIVDADSMATEYLSFGTIRMRSAQPSADTGAAIGVGQQVVRELRPRRWELTEAQYRWEHAASRGTR